MLGESLPETLYSQALNKGLWEQVVHLHNSENRSRQQLAVMSVTPVQDLPVVAACHEPRVVCVARLICQREELSQRWVSRAEHTLVNEAEHADVSAERDWGKVEIHKSDF